MTGMENLDALNAAFRSDPRRESGTAAERRARRAHRTRAQALSPLRILTQVLLIPVVTIAMTISIYTRTSPYGRTDALRHLAAMAGCDTAASMGLAPAFRGEIGYHSRNDPDGDGIACANISRAPETVMSAPVMEVKPRTARGAKFVTP
ncbi:MAG: excalibur calcium-binding domain-containing protein [Rhodobacter sp.]|jgi:hypothetical protein|nr:excalibur calcium-binding domain-containing protein [Rhodobacter sp.]